jgi:hypothetical protein
VSCDVTGHALEILWEKEGHAFKVPRGVLISYHNDPIIGNFLQYKQPPFSVKFLEDDVEIFPRKSKLSENSPLTVPPEHLNM